MKKFTFFSSLFLLSICIASCDKVDNNPVNEYSQEAISATFKVNVVPTVESTMNYIRFITASSSEAVFYTMYADSIIDVRSIDQQGKIQLLMSTTDLKDFSFKGSNLESKITVDTKGNFYTILANRNQPSVKTIWKYDIDTKTIAPFAKVNNGDLKFLSYWKAKNKLIVQDESKIYTLGLNEQLDELNFLIGSSTSTSSQPIDGVGTAGSVRLNFPVSYFDNDFFVLENNRFIRKVSVSGDQASVKTLSALTAGAYSYLTMISDAVFLVDRKSPEVGLSEGDFTTQNIKSYFFRNNLFFGYPIVYNGFASQELLVSTAMYDILGGSKNGMVLYTMNSYLPVDNALWSASKKSIVYIKDFRNQINQTKQIKL